STWVRRWVRRGLDMVLDRRQRRSATRDDCIGGDRKTGLPSPPLRGNPAEERVQTMLRQRGQRERARPAGSPDVSNRAGLTALGGQTCKAASARRRPRSRACGSWVPRTSNRAPTTERRRVFIRELKNVGAPHFKAWSRSAAI